MYEISDIMKSKDVVMVIHKSTTVFADENTRGLQVLPVGIQNQSIKALYIHGTIDNRVLLVYPIL